MKVKIKPEKVKKSLKIETKHKEKATVKSLEARIVILEETINKLSEKV